jgi:RimJ/RimL family protein N-acetyltransferase
MSVDAGRLAHVDHTSVRTDRLLLSAPAPTDLPELHALHADPRGYAHWPWGRHTTVEQTEQLLDRYRESWSRYGLGPWVLRSRADGRLVGMGGCSVRGDVGWNLYYRLVPEEWGHGYAQEVIAAARAAAADVRPDLPVLAYLLEHNTGSLRTVERAGLTRVWRGPDAGNPDPSAVRLVYADREVDERTVAVFAGA